MAAQEGFQDIVECLVEKGAEISAMNIENFLPLHAASHAGHFEVVGYLIQNGTDVNALSKELVTPLYLAAQVINYFTKFF